jgi:hypothetical protein
MMQCAGISLDLENVHKFVYREYTGPAGIVFLGDEIKAVSLYFEPVTLDE